MLQNFAFIIFAFIFVFLNGFFVAAEFAMVKLRHTQVAQLQKNRGIRGSILAKVHHHLDAYLSACQLGITLTSLALGWIGEPAFATILHPLFALFKIDSPTLISTISIAVAFFIISFLHIVIGELAPKSLAIRQPEKIALATALPLYGFYWLTYPVIWTLNGSANLILRITGLQQSFQHADNTYSAEEIRLILHSRHAASNANQGLNIVSHALELGNLKVADLMHPANEMTVISSDSSVEEIFQLIRHHRYSRYPYRNAETHQFEGILYIKDLLLSHKPIERVEDMRALLRDVEYVTRKTPLTDLLHRFQLGASHFSLVRAHGNEVVGFITLEDILEMVVGDIEDEYRQANRGMVTLTDGSLLIKGDAPVYRLERALNIEIDMPDDINSVSGLLMWRTDDIPKEGDRIEFEEFDIVVKRMKGPKILLTKVISKKNHSPSSALPDHAIALAKSIGNG
jgi:CBS domain containing-hemolysin-like protein